MTFVTGMALLASTGGPVPALATECLDYAKPFLRPLGWYEAPDWMTEPAVSGDRLACARWQTGLEIFDVTDPGHPVWRSAFSLPSVQGIAMHGDLVFATAGAGGLVIVNVADASAPVLEGAVDTPGDAHDVAVDASGTLACVADLGGGLQVIDVSDPAHPAIVGAIPPPAPGGAMRDVIMRGSVAFVAATRAGVLAVDLRNPAAPVVVGKAGAGGPALLVAAAGNRVYASCDTSLAVIDAADPAAMSLRSTLSTHHTSAMTAVASRVFLIHPFGGPMQPPGFLLVIDAADPAHPVPTDAVEFPGSAEGLAASGDRAWITDGWGGLAVLDITNPAPAPVVWRDGLHEPSCWRGSMVGMAMNGGWLYGLYDPGWCFDGPPGSRMYPAMIYRADLGDPARPVAGLPIYLQDAHAESGEMSFSQGLALVPNGGFLSLVSLDGDELLEVGYTELGRTARSVAARGTHAYVACAGTGIVVVDISDPGSPAIVASLDTPGDAWSVRLLGNHLLVADGPRGLTVIDVTDPRHPALAASIDTPGEARGVELEGHLAWIADGAGGILAVDCASPVSPVVVGTLDTPGIATRVAIDGPLAYVADGAAGLTVARVADPAHPALVGNAFTGAVPSGIQVSSGYVYLANGDHGFEVRARQCALVATGIAPGPVVPRNAGPTIAVSPNPSRGTVAIRMDGPGTDDRAIEVVVFDATGRRIRSLGEAYPRAGAPAELTWDGRTDRGGIASAGVYFVRVSWHGTEGRSGVGNAVARVRLVR